MRAFSGLVGMLAVLAIGYYIYSGQIDQGKTNSRPLVQQIDLTVVKTDLLSLGQAERYYLATNGRYATLEQLKQFDSIGSIPQNRHGYVYIAEVDGAAHFRITAKPVDSSRKDLPTLFITETMQVTW